MRRGARGACLVGRALLRRRRSKPRDVGFRSLGHLGRAPELRRVTFLLLVECLRGLALDERRGTRSDVPRKPARCRRCGLKRERELRQLRARGGDAFLSASAPRAHVGAFLRRGLLSHAFERAKLRARGRGPGPEFCARHERPPSATATAASASTSTRPPPPDELDVLDELDGVDVLDELDELDGDGHGNSGAGRGPRHAGRHARGVRTVSPGRSGHRPSHRTTSPRSNHATGSAQSSTTAAPPAGVSRARTSR
jgi:hypothetical protein